MIGGSEKTAKLFLASASSEGYSGKLAVIPVSADGGVDLGAVGRALGLEPSSVRLNGYFVSRDPDLVSSLTWGSLLSFFASRGLPVGASELNAMVVQGKPTLASGLQFSPVLVEGDHVSFKRKVTLEDEHPTKKKVVKGGNLGFEGVGDGYLGEDDNICIKRRLKLEDDCSSKKRKITDCSSGSMHESLKSPTIFQKMGSSFACINGHGKRLRQGDSIPAFPCKRVR
ncbi:hypothetical protein Cni_G13121 [Canna indica]|uniref:Uncharacterized protein n=1 Tax=Canna indica TaxID=4628 RepID=A0AAQ3KB83_9LILI|nr:hypothetical protein Cni_G13121 [Canna indica]